MFAPSQYIMGGLGLALVGALVWGYTEDANGDRLESWQDNIVAVTSTAAGVKDKAGKPALLKPEQVAGQIVAMGASVANLRGGIATCQRNAADRAATYRDTAARAAATEERLARQFESAQGSIARLQDIARRAVAEDNGQCRASPALMRELEGLQ